MLYQVMISGNVKRDVETRLNDVKMNYIYSASKISNITGLTAYTDGNFLSLLEGEKDKIDRAIGATEDDRLLASIMTLASYPIQERQFSDYSLGLRYEDLVGSFFERRKCFILTPTSLSQKIPEALPDVFQTLFRTFTQVNQLRSA